MNINKLIESNKFTLLTKSVDTDIGIDDVYLCDLLSWVMSHAGDQCAWITVQTHVNIVAIAVLLEMSCIILPEGIKPEENTLKKAIEENIVLLSTDLSAYEVACLINQWKTHG